MSTQPQPLSKKDNDLCTALGVSGTVLSLVVLLQHLILMIPFWVTYSMTAIYGITILSFILLANKKTISPVMLAISSALLFLLVACQIIAATFSLVVILLFLYTLVVTVLIFISEIPRKLKSNQSYLKKETDYWSNKL